MDSKYGYHGDSWGAANGGYERDLPLRHSRQSQRYGDDDFYRQGYNPQQGQRQRYPPMQGPPSGSYIGSPSLKEKGSSNNFSSLYKAGPDDGGKNSAADEPGAKRKGVFRIIKRFAEHCSMQGPPYIRASTWWLSRSLWTLMFLAALGAMTFHLFYLCQTYFLWPTKNSIDLGFESLSFPAVTVCNVNPVRSSMMSAMSPDFNRLVSITDPGNLGSVIEAVGFAGRKRRQVTVPNAIASLDDDDDEDDERPPALDRIDFGIPTNLTNARETVEDDELEMSLDGFEDSWEREAMDSTFTKMEQSFMEIYSAENRWSRVIAGHQLRDMLISCSFAGKTCHSRNFTLTTSKKYGNCYTLQYEKFISRQSGPGGGLELLFYLDRDNYLRGVTPDEGLQVVVHPFNTLAFPYDEGLAVAAGSHTMLSLKLVRIERMGSPYGECSAHEYFEGQYNVSYSRQTCQNLCQQTAIHSQCQCRDEKEDELNRIAGATRMKACRNKTEITCLKRVEWLYGQGKIECNCEAPCLENKYEKTMSTRPWPHADYARGVLVKAVCRKVDPAECARLTAKNNEEIQKEFVKLNIFFEDLNYENITEEPDYEDVQFISDLGGTMGLWIGLSVLSVMEVLQLFVEVIRHVLCCRWRYTSSSASTSS